MTLRNQAFYAFGPFRFDEAARVLLRGDDLVPLPPKAADLLLALMESAGQVVSKEELLRRVWPDTFVEEGNLAVNVFTLRKTLGGGDDEYIRTLPRRGYCFVAPVTRQNVERALTDLPAATSVAAPPAISPSVSPTAPKTARERVTTNWPFRLAFGALLAVVVALGTMSYVRLARSGSVGVPESSQSIAVLPFAMPGAAPGDEYLGPGLASVLANRLAYLQRVAVRPIASTMKYGAPDQAPMEAGRDLRVDVVLVGSIRRTAESLQIEAALVRTADGSRAWEWSTTTRLEDLGNVIGAIVEPVARLAEPAVTPAELARATARVGLSPDGFAAYLRGRAAGGQMTPRDVEQAIAHLTTATDLSPTMGEPFAGLAAYLTLAMNVAPTDAKYLRGEAAARQALSLDEGLAEPHTVLGRVAVVRHWDWDAAEREFKLAIARTPYDAEPHFWYALQLSATGQHEDALAEIKFALQIDPTSPRLNLYAGMLAIMARRYDDAIAQLKRTPIEMGVTNQQVYLAIAVAQSKKGRTDLALETLDRAVGRATPTVAWTAHRAYVLAAAGRDAEADAWLEKIPDVADLARPSHTVVAAALACRGRQDAAFTRLDRAYAERDSRVIFANVDPILDCARREPRFEALVARMHLARR